MDILAADDKRIWDYVQSMIPYYEIDDIQKLYQSLPEKQEFDSTNLKDKSFMDYQQRVTRLLDIHVPLIKNHLLFYQQGTGKTRIYLKLIENRRPHFKTLPIILVRNMKLMYELKKNIIAFDAINRTDRFARDDLLSTRSINSVINKYYRIYTYHEYAKLIEESVLNDKVQIDKMEKEHTDRIEKREKDVTFYKTEFDRLTGIYTQFKPINDKWESEKRYRVNRGENVANIQPPSSIIDFYRVDKDYNRAKMNLDLVYQELETLKRTKPHFVYTTNFDKLCEVMLDTMIVLDEPQHCKDNRRLKIYSLIYKVFSVLNNDNRNNILLCSGTPMIDSAHEFSHLMNLILDSPIELKFRDNEFVNKDEIKQALTGNVSYLKFKDDNIKINTNNIKKLLVSNKDTGIFYTRTDMSEFQSKVYASAWKKDRDSQKQDAVAIDPIIGKMEEDAVEDNDVDDTGIEQAESIDLEPETASTYSNTLQASLFAYPDESYGIKGYINYFGMSNPKEETEWKLFFRSIKLSDFIQHIESKNTTILSTNYTSTNYYIKNLIGYLQFKKYKHRVIQINESLVDNLDDLLQTYANYKVIIFLGSNNHIESTILDITKINDKADAAHYIKVFKYNNEVESGVKFRYNFNTNDGIVAFLDKVKISSSKYYAILKHIVDTSFSNGNFNPDHKIFIYSKFIGGSGAKVLIELLKIMGYSDVMKDKQLNQVKPRFMFVHSKVPDEITSDMLSKYNSAHNYKGDYIQLFIGTETVSEGITLKDTPMMFSVTQNWNMSSIEQAERRIVRIHSFDTYMKQKGLKNVDVYINRLISVPMGSKFEESDFTALLEQNEPIDSYMLKFAIKKDIKIKQVERLCKTVAFDCVFNKRYNEILDPSLDNTRECEYQLCKYVCDYEKEPVKRDYDSMDTFYKDEHKLVLEKIINFFKKQSICSHDYIVYYLKKNGHDRLRVVYDVLHDLIYKRTLINGNILKYDKGMFYMSNYFMDTNVYNYVYTKLPVISGIRKRLSSLISENKIVLFKNTIDKEANTKTLSYKLGNTMPASYDIHKMLEYSLILREQNKETTCSKFILSLYDEIWTSSILPNNIPVSFMASPYEIFSKNKWTNITQLKKEVKMDIKKYFVDYYSKVLADIYNHNNKLDYVVFGYLIHNPSEKGIKDLNIPSDAVILKNKFVVAGLVLKINIISKVEFLSMISEGGDITVENLKLKIGKLVDMYMSDTDIVEFEGENVRRRSTIFEFKGWEFKNLKIDQKRQISAYINDTFNIKNVYYYLKQNNLIIYY